MHLTIEDPEFEAPQSLLSPSQSVMTSGELPYLPGIRKYGSSSPISRRNWSRASLRSEARSVGSPSLSVSYEDLETFHSMLSPYPHEAHSFDELSGRYSMRAQRRDREASNHALVQSGFTSPIHSVVGTGDGGTPLSEITILRFMGYFREPVPNSRVEQMRIRKCYINYHLQDGSIDIVEPRTPNSGLLQGKYLRRHRVPNVHRPVTSEGFSGTRGHEEFITLDDLYVGANIYVYTQKITVVDCDERTRQYLRSIGRPAAEPIPIPLDDYEQFRLSLPKRQPRGNKAGEANKFFKYGSSVLRFFAVEEDADALDAEGVARFCIDYYLRDDTFEITRMGDVRKRPVAVLNRLRVPKEGHAAVTAMQAYEEDEHLYYHWTDFAVGAPLRILGHHYKIVDADPFTRRFYDAHGMPLMESLPSVPNESARSTTARNSVTMIEGADDDFFAESMGRDKKKVHHLSGVILKYGAMLARPLPGHQSRIFNIQVFLEDDTVQIRELPVRNSGFVGGKFLARGRHKNGNKLLVPTDLYLGARITMAATEFVVTGADGFTLDYMENHAHEWIYSDIHRLTDKLLGHKQPVQSVLMNDVHSPDGHVSFKEFNSLMKRRVGIDWNQQESVTLARAACPEKQDGIDTHAVLKLLEDCQQP